MIFENSEENYDNIKLCVWQPAFVRKMMDFEMGDFVYLNSNPESIMIILSLCYEKEEIKTCDINSHDIQHVFKPHCLQLYEDISFRRLRRTPFVISLN
jgi:hypothetical protein